MQKILYNGHFNYSHRAFELIDACIIELKSLDQTNLINACDLFDYTPQIIWTKDCDTSEAVGALVFCTMKSEYLFVILACVSPQHRRHGVFKRMWSELQVIAEQRKVRDIDLGVAMSNEVMHAVMKSIGALPRWVSYRSEVPQTSSVT